jgi:hypothetical protein
MALRNSDAVLSTLVAHTIGAAQEIPMARVAQATIPSGVKAYLRANLRDRFQTEVLRYGPFSRVQPLSASTSHLHELFFAHAAEGYVYPRGEYLADLENAAHFTENYVCRPRWTLTSFLFHDAPVISTTTLFTRLEYVTEYVYLPQLLRRMVTQKQLQEISQEDCAFLIRQIDSAVVREHTPRELALLTRPIFDYFLYGAQHWEQSIPLKPILLFFEDKELYTVEDLIRSLSQAKSRDSVSLAELAEMCDDYLTSTPLPAKPAPAPEKMDEAPEPASLRLVQTRPEDSSEINKTIDDEKSPAIPDEQTTTPGSFSIEFPDAVDTAFHRDEPATLDAKAALPESDSGNNGTAANVDEPATLSAQPTVPEPSSGDNGIAASADEPVTLDARLHISEPSSGINDIAASAYEPATLDAQPAASEQSPGIGDGTISIGDAARVNPGASGSEEPSHTTGGAPAPASIAESDVSATGSKPGSGNGGDTAGSEPITLMSYGQKRTPGATAVKVGPPESLGLSGDGITQISLHTLSGKSGGSAVEQHTSAGVGTPQPDLERMITPEQRKRFISVLCDRDADFYELVISRLNIMRTWSEAAAYIRELFEINSVDPFRDEAITFTDIVQQRFGTQGQPRI